MLRLIGAGISSQLQQSFGLRLVLVQVMANGVERVVALPTEWLLEQRSKGRPVGLLVTGGR